MNPAQLLGQDELTLIPQRLLTVQVEAVGTDMDSQFISRIQRTNEIGTINIPGQRLPVMKHRCD